MLRVYLPENPFANRKKPYSWHAKSAGRLTHERLIEAVAQANTTVTKADVLAVISEYERQFERALEEGFSVESFFVTLSVGAVGSTEQFKPEKPKDPRTPRRDHKITLNFKAKPAFLKKVKSTLQYKTERIQGICEPRLVYALDMAMDESRLFKRDDIIHLRGDFIKIDPNDEEQGVFIVGSGGSFRIGRYSRCTRNNIDTTIPLNIPEGEYRIEVRTKTTHSLQTSNGIPVTIA